MSEEPPKDKDRMGFDAQALAMRPRNWDELWHFAKVISETEFVPSPLRGKPGAVIAAVQYGNEVGLPPMTSLRWIAVINGTPSIWGDGYWMLVKNHPHTQWTKELSPDEAEKAGYGECTIKRKDDPEPTIRRYTKEMAERAGLWGGRGDTLEKKKKSPWYLYPGRMLQMRARSLCGRDAIPEATGPLSMREEAEDYIETTATHVAEKEEPLKIPESTEEKKDEEKKAGHTEGVQEKSGAGTSGRSGSGEGNLGDGGPNVDNPRDDTARGHDNRTRQLEKGDSRTEKKTKKKDKAKSPEEIEAEIIDWLNKEATREEILANTNTASTGMRALDDKAQLRICRVWNERKKQVQTEVSE